MDEVEPNTHLEKVIAGEAYPITHLEKVIAGEAYPITHLEKVIAEYGGGGSDPTKVDKSSFVYDSATETLTITII